MMARKFGAIMALLGMVVVLLRGLKDGSGFDETIIASLAWMALLGSVGVVIGYIADNTVVEAVRERVEKEMAMIAEQESNTAS